jgi:hypothetical protein
MGVDFVSEGPVHPIFAPFVHWHGGSAGDTRAFREFDPLDQYMAMLDFVFSHNTPKA